MLLSQLYSSIGQHAGDQRQSMEPSRDLTESDLGAGNGTIYCTTLPPHFIIVVYTALASAYQCKATERRRETVHSSLD